jgi:hypothetical protein
MKNKTILQPILMIAGLLLVGLLLIAALPSNPTGTNLMKRGSWVSFSKLGADTFTQNGGWA